MHSLIKSLRQTNYNSLLQSYSKTGNNLDQITIVIIIIIKKAQILISEVLAGQLFCRPVKTSTIKYWGFFGYNYNYCLNLNLISKMKAMK